MKVGSLVECISDRPTVWPECKPVVLGEIYTVRGFETLWSPDIGVFLEEITNVPHPIDPSLEFCYKIDRFKEIQPPMEIKLSDLIPENQYA